VTLERSLSKPADNIKSSSTYVTIAHAMAVDANTTARLC
jgi:hypothetical protein